MSGVQIQSASCVKHLNKKRLNQPEDVWLHQTIQGQARLKLLLYLTNAQILLVIQLDT